MSSFLGSVTAPTPELDAFIEAKEYLVKAGVDVGPAYEEFELKVRGRQAMVLDDAPGLCLLCSPNHPTMQALAAKGFSKAQLTAAAEALVVDGVLEVAGK